MENLIKLGKGGLNYRPFASVAGGKRPSRVIKGLGIAGDIETVIREVDKIVKEKVTTKNKEGITIVTTTNTEKTGPKGTKKQTTTNKVEKPNFIKNKSDEDKPKKPKATKKTAKKTTKKVIEPELESEIKEEPKSKSKTKTKPEIPQAAWAKELKATIKNINNKVSKMEQIKSGVKDISKSDYMKKNDVTQFVDNENDKFDVVVDEFKIELEKLQQLFKLGSDNQYMSPSDASQILTQIGKEISKGKQLAKSKFF